MDRVDRISIIGRNDRILPSKQHSIIPETPRTYVLQRVTGILKKFYDEDNKYSVLESQLEDYSLNGKEIIEVMNLLEPFFHSKDQEEAEDIRERFGKLEEFIYEMSNSLEIKQLSDEELLTRLKEYIKRAQEYLKNT